MDLPRRVIGILTSPRHEWSVVADEPGDVAALYWHYIAILAAIPSVSILVGLALGGGRFLGTAGITTAITAAIVGYVMALASPLVAAVAIQKLAPSFKADGDTPQALKLVAYASTPVWLASMCYVSVALSPLVVLGVVWAIYLFYLGLPVVLKTPHEQVVPFMLVSALTVIVVNVAPVARSFRAASALPILTSSRSDAKACVFSVEDRVFVGFDWSGPKHEGPQAVGTTRYRPVEVWERGIVEAPVAS